MNDKEIENDIKKLGDLICEFCPWTSEGASPVSVFGSCDGKFCAEAYENYLDECKGDGSDVH